MNETTIEITPGAIRAHYARRNLDAPTSFDMAELAKAAIWFRELKAADELLRLIEEGWTSAEIEAGELRHDGSMITNAGQVYRPPPPSLPPDLRARAAGAVAALRRAGLHVDGIGGLLGSKLEAAAYQGQASTPQEVVGCIEQAERLVAERQREIAERAATARPAPRR